MLTSITPLGERGRSARWGLTTTAYLAGSTVAGAALGALVGLAGAGLRHAVPGPVRSAGWPLGLLVALVALAGAAADLRLAGLRVPTVHRQVDEDWLHRYRGWVYGVGFGAQLGLGVVTIVTTAAVYLAFGLALLTGSWAAGLAVGAVFGSVRALPTLATVRVRSAPALAALHRGVARRHGPARMVAALTQLAVAGGALVTVVAR